MKNQKYSEDTLDRLKRLRERLRCGAANPYLCIQIRNSFDNHEEAALLQLDILGWMDANLVAPEEFDEAVQADIGDFATAKKDFGVNAAVGEFWLPHASSAAEETAREKAREIRIRILDFLIGSSE